MGSVSSAIGSFAPSLSVGSFFIFIGWALLFLIIVGVAGFSVYYFIKMRKFKYKIVVHKKQGNIYVPEFTDRAMDLRVGGGGDLVIYTLKSKRVLPFPQLQTGKNTYYFWIRGDGELINFQLSDFDEIAKKMGAHFLDKEMRYARVQLQGSFKDRFEKKKSWLLENASIIFNVVAFTMMGIILWLIVREIPAIIDRLGPVIEASTKLTEKQDALISKMDTLCSGGSGLVKAVIPVLFFWRND